MKEAKRARTLRTELISEIDGLREWLRASEMTIQERNLEPEPLKQTLTVSISIQIYLFIIRIIKI